jgi:hypothetical protein
MSLEQKTTHVADAQARLLEQFKNQPKILALVDSLTAPEVDAEAVLFAVRAARNIDTAVGVQLDRIGRIVGEERQGREDDVYRLYLKVRVALNRASGTGDEILNVMSLVLGDSLDALEFYYPASLVVEAIDLEVSAPDVARILGDVVAAGVYALFVYSSYPEEETFSFYDGEADDSTEIIDAARGFASEAFNLLSTNKATATDAAGNTSGFTAISGASLTSVTGSMPVPAAGPLCLRVANAGDGRGATMSVSGVTHNAIAPLATFTFSVYLLGDASNMTTQVTLEAVGNVSGTLATQNVAISDAGWVRGTLTYTCGLQDTLLTIRMLDSGGSSAGTLFFADALQVEAGAVATAWTYPASEAVTGGHLADGLEA